MQVPPTPKPSYKPTEQSLSPPSSHETHLATKPGSGIGPEGSKHLKLNKGKGKVIVDRETSPEVEEPVATDGSNRSLFREPIERLTFAGLDRLRLNKEERKGIKKVSRYNIYGGTSYPQVWCSKYQSLTFFTDILREQGWENACRFNGPVYPVEVLQFYGTVRKELGVLTAVVNGVTITLAIDEFNSLFSAHDDGMEIDPEREWDNFSGDEKLSVKRVFDSDSSVNDTISATCLGPTMKFLFIFLWNTVVPRRAGRDKICSYEMMIVKEWIEKSKVNLGFLVFARILQTTFSAKEDRVYTTLDLPYGMWISHILLKQGAIDPDSYGVIHLDEMNDTYLKYMKLDALGPELMFQVKGNQSGGNVGAQHVEKSVEVDLTATCGAVGSATAVGLSDLEARLDMFMATVMSRLDAQEKHICEVVNGVAARMGPPATTGIGATSSVSSLGYAEFLKQMDELKRVCDSAQQDCIRTQTNIQYLVTQGGGLLQRGTWMQEDMQVIHAAVQEMIRRVINFDIALTAQGRALNSCLDRLSTLEFRTRPGYIAP